MGVLEGRIKRFLKQKRTTDSRLPYVPELAAKNIIFRFLNSLNLLIMLCLVELNGFPHGQCQGPQQEQNLYFLGC